MITNTTAHPKIVSRDEWLRVPRNCSQRRKNSPVAEMR